MEGGAVARAFEAIEAAVAVLTAEVAELRPGSSSDPDPLNGVAHRCLDVLTVVSRSEAQIAALKAGAAAGYAEAAASLASPVASARDAMAREMAVTAEIACVLTIGERAAGALLAQAHALTTTLPLTLSALQAGSISWQHARAMIDEAACLDPAGAGALEAHFLDPEAPNPARGCPAGELPASRFRHKARTWRERHHAESIEKRHAKGVLDRRVEYTPDQDGMAWLSVYLPAATANRIWNRTTAVARGLQGPDESRTLPQLRADVLAAAFLSTGSAGMRPGHVPPPRAHVLVTVPVFSLLGATDEPAMLDGYGPIPASMARGLVANGADSFYRVLVDPRDGAPLEIGRTSYRLTKAMRNWLRLRDGKCPFPGCSNHSLDNEADHLLAWHKGGTTGINNLGQPCRKHHRLKHASTWTPTAAAKNEPPGWTSPSGRHYRSEQQDWEPPSWPRNLKRTLNLPALNSNAQRPHSAPPYAPCRHSYFDHACETLGEDSLHRFLHADA